MLDDESKKDLLKEYTDMLYNQALILEGSKPRDPAAFARTVSKLMVEGLKKGS